jgi:hypothetical protein
MLTNMRLANGAATAYPANTRPAARSSSPPTCRLRVGTGVGVRHRRRCGRAPRRVRVSDRSSLGLADWALRHLSFWQGVFVQFGQFSWVR